MFYKKISLKERFEKHFIKLSDDECWEWNASIKKNGYGRINVNGKIELAHRISWILYRDKIPEGLGVLHTCDNRKCVNPNHFFLGTNVDNSKDMVNKGRQIKGEQHPFAKLTDKQIIEIRNSNEVQNILAKKFNITQGHVSNIKNNKRRNYDEALESIRNYGKVNETERRRIKFTK